MIEETSCVLPPRFCSVISKFDDGVFCSALRIWCYLAMNYVLDFEFSRELRPLSFPRNDLMRLVLLGYPTRRRYEPTLLCLLPHSYIPPMVLHKTAIKPLHVLSSFLLRLKKVVRRGICSVSLPLCHNSRTRAPKCSSCLALCVTTYQCPILPKKIRGGTVRLFCSILSL